MTNKDSIARELRNKVDSLTQELERERNPPPSSASAAVVPSHDVDIATLPASELRSRWILHGYVYSSQMKHYHMQTEIRGE
jgi:hypothetical protein